MLLVEGFPFPGALGGGVGHGPQEGVVAVLEVGLSLLNQFFAYQGDHLGGEPGAVGTLEVSELGERRPFPRWRRLRFGCSGQRRGKFRPRGGDP